VTAAEATTLVGVVVSLISAVVVPIHLVRRSERRAKQDREDERRAEVAAGTEVSWVAINKAIVKERDDLRAELHRVSKVHERQIQDARENLEKETEKLKAHYDLELARANERIKQLSEEVDRLYKRLYGASGDPRPPGVT
jgi:hypothetical protein